MPRHWDAHVRHGAGTTAAKSAAASPAVMHPSAVEMALEERAKIVRWLKAHDYWAYTRIAEMIEKGEHLR